MPQTYEQRKASKLRKLAEAAGTTAAGTTPDTPAVAGHLTPAKPMRTVSLVHHADASAPDNPVDDDPDFAPVAPQTGTPVVTPVADDDTMVITGAAPQRTIKARVTLGEAFALWLASPQGKDCTDPRQPADALRRGVDLETRLKLAFMAGVAVLASR